MTVVTIHVAKTTLSQLVSRAEGGEEIVLARGREPVAKLVPIEKPTSKRQFGALRGKVSVASAFFEPLPEDELLGWDQ